MLDLGLVPRAQNADREPMLLVKADQLIMGSTQTAGSKTQIWHESKKNIFYAIRSRIFCWGQVHEIDKERVPKQPWLSY